MKTLEQLRAEHAMERVNELDKAKTDEIKKLYRSYIDSLGPAILMNGLGQALATEIAAAGSDASSNRGLAHKAVYESIESWLCRKDGGIYSSDLLNAIVTNDEEHYLRAQVEALAWLEWHKKFCRAYFPEPDNADR